jgi:glucose 1-dehydrogenase
MAAGILAEKGAIRVTSRTALFQPRITPVAGRLQGKVALVTGGAKGIGKAIAIRFAQEGADVVITDRDAEASLETTNELRALGCKALSAPADVSDRSAIEDMVQRVLRDFGPIDILVNNAGIIVFGSLMQCRPEDWDRMLAVDLTGSFHCTQLVGQHMAKRGGGGRLIHIGSTASLLPTAEQGAYCVAKAGLRMMSMMAAMELAPHGITSNLLCPQGAVTDINRELLSDSAVMAKLEANIPAGRMAKTEEIAAAAAFLASDEAAYITGTELVHDGGATIGSLWWR